MSNPDSSDPYNLQRFIDAQDSVFGQVCSELKRGQKTGHWMWFIFPQIQGLGDSPTTRYYAITALAEARAYLEHPVLGARLRECTQLVIAAGSSSAVQIFGSIDALKFRSSMTLFTHATSDNQLFQDALNKYFNGQFDDSTLQRI